MRPDLKILLVDDQPAFREDVRRLLSKHSPYQIVGEAGNGQEAMAQAEALRPDVILMDLDMPVMNGLQATQQLSSRFKILILTSHDTSQFQEAARQAGACGYVVKTDLFADLVPAIEACFSQGNGAAAMGLSKL